MSKHIIGRTASVNYRVPENIPPTPRFRALLVDAPWVRNQAGHGSRGGAIRHHDVPLDQAKNGSWKLFPQRQ